MFKLIKDIKSKIGEQHFKRWNVLSTPWFRIYIHEITLPDKDEHLHSHPWNFLSILLKGGYMEAWMENNQTTKIRYRITECKAPCFLFRKAKDFHQIKELFGKTYSLVIAFGKRRQWGFYVDGEVVPNEDYRKMKHNRIVYYPYNETFGRYALPRAGKRAQEFIDKNNQLKGGHWVLHSREQYQEWYQSKGRLLEKDYTS